MGVKHGALERSMHALTFGVAREITTRANKLRETRLEEREQEFQVSIEGSAGTEIAWSDVRLDFAVDFVNATGQRHSPYTEPTFTYGYEIETRTPVMIFACVTKWLKDDRETVTGVELSVGTLSGTSSPIKFSGALHAIFSGYGAPAEDESDEDS